MLRVAFWLHRDPAVFAVLVACVVLVVSVISGVSVVFVVLVFCVISVFSELVLVWCGWGGGVIGACPQALSSDKGAKQLV